MSEGRVTIRRIGDDLIVAHVRGDTAEVYAVTWARTVGPAAVLRSVDAVTSAPCSW